MVAVSPVVDWTTYFNFIQTECPWSRAAFSKGKIDIVKSRLVLPLGNYEARVYVYKDITPRRLKKICKQRDATDLDCEWLWSHPRYKNYSTPVPVLIQQDRQKLNKIRQNLKVSDRFNK